MLMHSISDTPLKKTIVKGSLIREAEFPFQEVHGVVSHYNDIYLIKQIIRKETDGG